MAEYTYEPLNPDVDTLRLIELNPSKRFDASVSCQLKQLKFSQLPRYDALSYRWGDANKKQTIFVDGKALQIGENLFEALRSLRNRANPLPLWADAISINQQDITERNRQIRLMPHIYNRAVTVLVWLGRRSFKHKGESWHQWTTENREMRQQYRSPNPRPKSPQYNAIKMQQAVKATLQQVIPPSILEKEIQPGITKPYSPREQLSPAEEKLLIKDSLHRDLCNDPYWRRVWIVQEIGKARKVLICFDENTLHWSEFILEMKLNPKYLGIYIENCGPIRIDRQLQNKYQDGHTLVTLLKTYKNSKCEDPRDKIYGFVGLASDCYGFPMDYSKSTYEVWEDAMKFIARNDLAEGISVLELGRLIKQLLGGKMILPETPTSLESIIESSSAHPEQFKLTTFNLGEIVHIGPSPQTLMAEMDAVDKWNEKIYKNFKTTLGWAFEENENFIHALEKIYQASFKRVAASNQKNQDSVPIGHHGQETALGTDINTPTGVRHSKDLSAPKVFDSSQFPLEPRLFLYKGASNGIIGIAPLQASDGDRVCRLPGVDEALVIRFGNKFTFGKTGGCLVGKAVLSEDLFEKRSPSVKSNSLDILQLDLEANEIFSLIT